MTDMETPAGEGLRRRRGGGREGHARNALPQQPPWAQPRMRYRPTEVVSADELEAIHIGSLRVLSEIGMDFLDAEAREVLRAAGAQTDRGLAARAVRPGHGHRAHQDRARDVHPARLEPGARPGARRRLGRVRDGRQPAQRRRPRPRPADRQPRRLPEPAPPGPVAQLGPLPGRLPGRAGRHPPRRPPPPRHLRRADADGQADPRLQPRARSATSTPSRWSASRAASTPSSSIASRRSSPSSTRARRSGSTRRCSRGSSSSRPTTRSCASRRSRCPGAMAPVTLAGALVPSRTPRRWPGWS